MTVTLCQMLDALKKNEGPPPRPPKNLLASFKNWQFKKKNHTSVPSQWRNVPKYHFFL